MQIVRPIDVEEALRLDLGAAVAGVAHRTFAPPAPHDLSPGDVMVTGAGGAPSTPVTHEYDVSVDCWSDTDEGAMALADIVHGVLSSLPVRETRIHWHAARAMAPYPNPDPNHPDLCRATFTATVTCRGEEIDL